MTACARCDQPGTNWSGRDTHVGDPIWLCDDHALLDALLHVQANIADGYVHDVLNGERIGDDAYDGMRSALAALAELVDFRYGDEMPGFTEWCAQDPTEWGAVDGDVRWFHPAFANIVKEWES